MNFKGHIWISGTRFVQVIKSQQESSAATVPPIFKLHLNFNSEIYRKNIDGADMFGPVGREALRRGRLCWERRLNVSSTSGI